jgi:hypothetical protein
LWGLETSLRDTEILRLFDELVVDAATGILDTYGLRARVGYLEPELTREHCLATVMGFVGSGLRGSLMLLAPRRVIAATSPNVDWDESRLRDWIGELGNQTLGCVRRGLVARGVRITVGLPAVVAAIHLDIRSIDDRYTRAFAFQTPAGAIMVTIDAVVSETYDEAPGFPEEYPSESKIGLF